MLCFVMPSIMGRPAALHTYSSTGMIPPSSTQSFFPTLHQLLHSSQSPIPPPTFINMAPKTHFTIPLNKGADPATTPTQWGRWATHTTEKISLEHQSKCGVSSMASGSHCQGQKNSQINTPIWQHPCSHFVRLPASFSPPLTT